VKRQLACIIRKIGKWLICQADRMAMGTERVEIVIDNTKRQAAIKAIEDECNLDAIREKGRIARMERAKMVMA
jgi:hypothetical protein